MFIITVCSSLHSFATQSFQKAARQSGDGNSPVWQRVWDGNNKLSCMTWLRVPHSPLCNQYRCPHLILCEENPHDTTAPHPDTHTAPSALSRWPVKKLPFNDELMDIYMMEATTAASVPHQRKKLKSTWVLQCEKIIMLNLIHIDEGISLDWLVSHMMFKVDV